MDGKTPAETSTERPDEIPISLLRERLSDTIDQARITGESFVVTRRGRRIARIIPLR